MSPFADGLLSVSANAADNIAITSSGGNVLINGGNPNLGPAVAASSVTEIRVSATGAFVNIIDLSGVTEALFQGLLATGRITIDAGPGGDTITGSDLGDRILDGAGNDVVTGGAGDDTYVLAPGGDDTINDAAGTDTIDFSTSGLAVTIDLNSVADQDVYANGDMLDLNDLIENFIGSPQNDAVTVASQGISRTISGGGNTAMPGDRLTVTATSTTIGVTATSLSVGGTINYDTFESLTLNGTAAADTITVTSTPNAATLTIDGLDGGDDYIVSQSGVGTAAVGVAGLTLSDTGASGDDDLILNGGAVHTITYNHASASSGDIEIDPDGPGGTATSTIEFSGFEPIVNSGTATNVEFNLTAGADMATLCSSTCGAPLLAAGMMRLFSAGTFELTDFAVPSGSLTIKGGGGAFADTITIGSVPASFTGSLAIDGEDGSDTIDVNAALNLSATTADLSLTAENISLDGVVVTTGRNQNFSGTTITLGNNTSLTATGGSITLGAAVNSAAQTLAVTADDNLAINDDITVASLTAQAGVDGTGNVSFGAGVQVNATTQEYRAGNGPGAPAAAEVDLTTNAPAFRNTAGAAAPTTFTYRQDASIVDADVPTAAQFGGTPPATYTLHSDEGAVTLATPAKVAGSNLTVEAATEVSLSGGLSLASLDATAGTHIALSGAVTSLGTQTYHSPVVLAADVAITAATAMFESTVDTADGLAAGAGDLTLSVAATTTFTGIVGSDPLGVVTKANLGSGAGAAITITSAGTTEFQAAVATASGIVQAIGAGNVTARQDLTMADGDTGSNFAETLQLDGLTLSGFDGLAVGTLILSGGSVSLNSNGGAIQIGTLTGGAQDLTLVAGIGAATTTVTGNTSNLGDGTGAALTVAASVTGLVRFQGTIAANSGLSAADGTNIRFDDNVTLLAGDMATSLNGNTTLDGLTFTANHNVTLGNAAGDALTISGGPVVIDTSGAASAAAGEIDVNATTTLGTALTLNAGDSNIRVDAPMSGTQDVTLNSTADTIVAANLGTPVALATLTTNAGGTVSLRNVTTTGNQTYQDTTATLNGTHTTSGGAFRVAGATTLAGATVVTTAGGAITFNSTIDGAFDLTTTTTGLTSFDSAIGAGPALASLTVDSGGPFAFVANATATGAIDIDVTDAAAADNITQNAGTTVRSTGGFVRYRAGDDITLAATATLTANAALTIVGDFGDNDAAGSTINLAGAFTGSSVAIETGDDADTVTIAATPATVTTTISTSANADMLTVTATGINSTATVHAGAGGDTITLAATGSSSVNTVNGDAGDDNIDFRTTGALSANTVNAGDDSDTIRIGSTANSLNGLLSPITVDGGAMGATNNDTLNVHDDGTGGPGFSYDLFSTHVSRSASTIRVNYADIESLALRTSTGSDMIAVDLPDRSAIENPLMEIAFPGLVALHGGTGNDVVRYNGSLDADVLTYSDIGGGGQHQLSGIDCSVVVGGAGGDTISNTTAAMTDAGKAVPSAMDLGLGNDQARGANNVDVIYGGPGREIDIDTFEGDDFVFPDHDAMGNVFIVADEGEGVGNEINGGNGINPATGLTFIDRGIFLTNGAGDTIGGFESGIFDGANIRDVIMWLRAQFLTGGPNGNAAHALLQLADFNKCANWHHGYSGSNLGNLTTKSIASVDPSAKDVWYEFHATQTAQLMAQATYSAASGGVELAIFDGMLNHIDSAWASGGTTALATSVAAGGHYYFRVRSANPSVGLDLSIGQPMPGDFNLDGRVSIADLSALKQALGSTSAAFDLNGDGIVSTGDLGYWVTHNFGGKTASPAAPAPSAAASALVVRHDAASGARATAADVVFAAADNGPSQSSALRRSRGASSAALGGVSRTPISGDSIGTSETPVVRARLLRAARSARLRTP
jgi:hypothetical protein